MVKINESGQFSEHTSNYKSLQNSITKNSYKNTKSDFHPNENVRDLLTVTGFDKQSGQDTHFLTTIHELKDNKHYKSLLRAKSSSHVVRKKADDLYTQMLQKND